MEQLFAVKVLLHYHDKPKVDHLAIHRLLSAADVESLRIIRNDGSSVSLLDHINTHASERKQITEVLGSRTNSLVQVAFIFMLAEARAAADAVATSPAELETVCVSLERLLRCLNLYKDLHPLRDWGQLTKIRIGTNSRRRSITRTSETSSDSNQYQVSILKAVNAVLRLCDVATHCLAVVSRQSVASRAICDTAVNLSTRLLTLAESLCQVQHVQLSPALSFFSSNSLRTALVTGAMHLGTITIEHPETEPMPWIHLANRIVVSSSTQISPRTSILSALFGGMIQAGKKYESSERDSKAAEGALCLLSTLHVVLETDASKELSQETADSATVKDSSKHAIVIPPSNGSSQVEGSAPISQAARSFLGERVVAAEEDGDEGRIAARTVYQACEEYAQRAGEVNGVIGLLSSLFTAAGRQCRQESVDDANISVCEGNVTCAPDESDASSDASHLRSEGQQFPIDVFEQRSKDGFGTGATLSSTSETGPEQAERSELHREIGALTLDILGHWITRAHTLGRYADYDFSDLLLTIYQSAAMFTFTNSPTSYDLQASMTDFSSLIRGFWENVVQKSKSISSEDHWKPIITNLIRSSRKTTPILTTLLENVGTDIAVTSLTDQFLERGRKGEAAFEAKSDECSALPTENMFSLLLSRITRENALTVVSMITECLSNKNSITMKSGFSLMFYVSSLILIGYASTLCLGISKGEENVRVAGTSLFRRDQDGAFDPILPELLVELDNKHTTHLQSLDKSKISQLCSMLQRVVPIVLQLNNMLSPNTRKELSHLMDQPVAFQASATSYSLTTAASERGQILCYHLFWSYLFLQRPMRLLRINFPEVHLQHLDLPEEANPLITVSPFLTGRVADFFERKVNTCTLPDFTSCFISETTALLQLTNSTHRQKGLACICLKVLLNTVIGSISEWLYDDPSSNFSALKRSISESKLPEQKFGLSEIDRVRNSLNSCDIDDFVLCRLLLGMSYLRSIGSRRISDLLAQVMLTCCRLLPILTTDEIQTTDNLTVRLASIFLFLPESHIDLQQAINLYIIQAERLQNGDSGSSNDTNEQQLLQLYQICGFCDIANRNSSSTTGIQLLCSFINEISCDDSDSKILQIALRSRSLSTELGTRSLRWLHSLIPPISLEKILSVTLVPEDEAAVAVSAHARSLELLTQACKISDTWREATLSGFHRLVLQDQNSFPNRMVRRSIMLSATMSEALVLFTNYVIGKSNSELALEVVEASFEVTKTLILEEDELQLDAFVRLFNFAIHLSICYGHVASLYEGHDGTSFLEGKLFDLILETLHRTTCKLQGDLVDDTTMEIAYFLCGLIDSARSGLFSLERSYYLHLDDQTLTETSGEDVHETDQSMINTGDSRCNDSLQSPDSQVIRSREAENEKPQLCTFTETGSDFVDQPWYFCYSCDLAGLKGVCAVCARICHKGCELAYSKRSKFFCDCGADSIPKSEAAQQAAASSEEGDGSAVTPTDASPHPFRRIPPRKPRLCQCLRPATNSSQISNSRKTTIQDKSRGELSPTHERERRLSAQSQVFLKTELTALRQAAEEKTERAVIVREELKTNLKSETITTSLIESCLRILEQLDGSYTHEYNTQPTWLPLDKVSASLSTQSNSANYRQRCESGKVATCTRLFKAGTLNVAQAEKDEKRILQGSLLSYSPHHRVLAIAEKNGYIEFIDVSDILIHSESSGERITSSSFRKTNTNFTPLDISFHPENSNLLLVVGKSKASVLCRVQQGDGYGWINVEVEIGLAEYEGFQGSNELLRACWIEGYPTLLLVVTEYFVKIFDVSADAFCPCFFAKTPGNESLTGGDSTPIEENSSKSKISCASVSLERTWLEDLPSFLVFIMTSNGIVFATRAKYNESSSPSFTAILNLNDMLENEGEETKASDMDYNRGSSLLTISLDNGNILCSSLMFRVKDNIAQSTVFWTRMYQEAATGNGNLSIRQIPGTETGYIFYRNHSSLSSAGVAYIRSDNSMHIQTFNGNHSTTLLGLAPFRPSMTLGEPRVGGGFFVLDDGSLHRVDLQYGRTRPQFPELNNLSEIVKQKQTREQKSQERRTGGSGGYSPLPDPIGFFENCRPVADNVVFESSEAEQYPGFNFQRMGVILAGSDNDCIVSPKENQPFKFSARVENESIVLVGARVHFGGTESSRNRVPSDVKVFGRPVRWRSQNGRKRWLDIPFRVAESSKSPRKVSFEFFPRRKIGDAVSDGDGFVAVDSLALYHISNIDFAERKRLYEKEKKEYLKHSKAKRQSNNIHSQSRSELLKSLAKGDESPKTISSYSQAQAAILTILSAIDESSFLNLQISGKLLLEINNLWSTSNANSLSRTSSFLKGILPPLVSICTRETTSGSDDHHQKDEKSQLSCLHSLSSTMNHELKLIRESILANASLSQLVRMEKLLFAVAGIARGLLAAGCAAASFPKEPWIEMYERLMPPDFLLEQLFSAFYRLHDNDRTLLSSDSRSLMNAVDIMLVYLARFSFCSAEVRNHVQNKIPVKAIIKMLSSVDRLSRLVIAQRIIHVLDSVEDSAKKISSPLEGFLASTIKANLETITGEQFYGNTERINDDKSEDSDATQRWAYRCDSCTQVCDQEWWHCYDCEDYDLCTSCLRKSFKGDKETHPKDHILLHGTTEEDAFGYESTVDQQVTESLKSLNESLFEHIVNEILAQMQMSYRKGNFWQFLEAMDTIVEMIGPVSPPELRSPRLMALFKSSFVDILIQKVEALETDLQSANNRLFSSASIFKDAEVLFFLLRILMSAPMSVIPVHIHRRNIPAILFRLVQKMHEKLTIFSDFFNTHRSVDKRNTGRRDLIPQAIWNQSIPGITSSILLNYWSQRTSSVCGDELLLFDGLPQEESIFMCLLLEVLRVLEYSYRSAASAPIVNQMTDLPRKALCDVINFCNSPSSHPIYGVVFKEISMIAANLLSAIALDDTDALNSILDRYLYEEETKQLSQILAKYRGSNRHTCYKTTVEIARILQSLHSSASSHPGIWSDFVSANDDVIPEIYEAVMSSGNELQTKALQLLATGLSLDDSMAEKTMKSQSFIRSDQWKDTEHSSQQQSDSTNDPGLLTYSGLVELGRSEQKPYHSLYRKVGPEYVEFIILKVMLSSQSKHARNAAAQVLLLGIAKEGANQMNTSFISCVHKTIVRGIEIMPYVGDLADGFIQCVEFFVHCCQNCLFGDESTKLLDEMTGRIFYLLKQSCSTLVSHPNARLYVKLASIVDLEGYYLESEPCMTCASTAWESSEYRELRVDSIRAETKHTDCVIVHRLVSFHEISELSVKVIEPRKTRRVKKIEVYYSSKVVPDATELKRADHPWQRLQALELSASVTEAGIELLVPITCANLKFEFAEFHPLHEVFQIRSGESQDQERTPLMAIQADSQRNNGGGPRSIDSLQCPRCSRSVTDRHGICRNCHENAYQCRQCRNINYENLDGFLCNECGFCKHGRFEFSVTGRITHVVEPILNEEDRKGASRVIEKETESVQRCIEQLSRMRSSLLRSLSHGITNEENGDRSEPLNGTPVGLSDLLDSVSPRTDVAFLEALLEGQVSRDIEDTVNSGQGVSITEEVIAESNASGETQDRDQNQRGTRETINGNDGQEKAGSDENTLVNHDTNSLAIQYAKECKSVFSTISRGMRILAMTRTELIRYANSVGGERLQLAKDFASESINEDAVDYDKKTQTFNPLQRDYSKPRCYGCTQSFISKCTDLTKMIIRSSKSQFTPAYYSELPKDLMIVCSMCEHKGVQYRIRELITLLVQDNDEATKAVFSTIEQKVQLCINLYETVDAQSVVQFEMTLLEHTASLNDSCWEERLRVVMRILFIASNRALTCSSVSETIILPCLRVALRLLRMDMDKVSFDNDTKEDTSRMTTEPIPVLTDTNDMDVNEIEREGTNNASSETGSVGDDPRSLRTRDPPSANGSSSAHQSETNVRSPVHSVDLIPDQLPLIPPATQHRSASSPPNLQNSDGKRTEFRNSGDGALPSSAPSSLGTGGDVCASDDEHTSQLQLSDLDASVIDAILENNHDSKVLTADVNEWLKGDLSQTQWTRGIKRGMLDEDQKTKQTSCPPSPMSIHILFNHWRRWTRSRKRVAGSFSSNSEPGKTQLQELKIEEDNWLVRLILFSPSIIVRKEACSLLKLLCGKEELLQLQTVDMLVGPALAVASDIGESSKEYFDLLEEFVSQKIHRMYLLGKGFPNHLGSLICAKAQKLILAEVEAESSLRLVNCLEGYSLKRMISILRLLIEIIPPNRTQVRQRLFNANDGIIVRSLQRAYVCVRKLISLRTKLTDECASLLSETLISRTFLCASSTIAAVVTACVTELQEANQRNDAQAVAILLDELCLMLCPERKKPTCHLILNKAPTQEEFIRGSMSRNPYSSSSFDGPLMRDVKNKICTDLDLPGLLEDDFAMELLVAGKLIKLELPIMSVYEHIWRGSAAETRPPTIQTAQISRAFAIRRTSHAQSSRSNGIGNRSAGLRGTILSIRRLNSDRSMIDDDTKSEVRQDPPMVVTYRLSGLDGEATEEIIDTLPNDSASDENVEELYKDTIVLGQVGGLDVLFKLLSVVGSWGDDAETAVRAPALRLLRASCEVSQNRALLAKSPHAVSTVLDCAASAFEHAAGSPAAIASAESLLIAAEKILAQQSKESENETVRETDAVQISLQDPNEVLSKVSVFLKRLEVVKSASAQNSILHLLPFLMQGTTPAMQVVLEHFSFSWGSIDNEEDQKMLWQLGTVLFATPNDTAGRSFVSHTISDGFADKAVEYLISKFPLPKHSHKETWSMSLTRSAPPLVLRILTSLAHFLDPTSNCSLGLNLRETVMKHSTLIPSLCQLEMAVSSNAIGTTAEELLEAFGRDGIISEQISKERKVIRKARREAAQASRAAVLREAGLIAALNEPSSKPASTEIQSVQNEEAKKPNEVMQLLEEVPDEIGPSCVVCGDGFLSRPDEALCAYVLCRRAPLEFPGTNSRSRSKQDGASSVTESNSEYEWEMWSQGRSRSQNNNGKPGSGSCYTTVTHFNAIHIGCHKEAARVDRSSRRDEWDGAALRNSQTKCNNLFPIRPPATIGTKDESEKDNTKEAAIESYSEAVNEYFGRLNTLGRVNLPQAKIVIYDLGKSLARFADGRSVVFSEHAKGGGPHSNAMLLPHLVQLAIFTIEGQINNTEVGSFNHNVSLRTIEENLARYVQDDEPGDITYYLAAALVLFDLKKWHSSICNFLTRGFRDKQFDTPTLLRLILFCDIANTVIKKEVSVTSEEKWLDAIRKYIGTRENFGQEFGDTVNDRWEEYIRHVAGRDSFLSGFKRNMELQDAEASNDTLLIQLDQLFKENP